MSSIVEAGVSSEIEGKIAGISSRVFAGASGIVAGVRLSGKVLGTGTFSVEDRRACTVSLLEREGLIWCNTVVTVCSCLYMWQHICIVSVPREKTHMIIKVTIKIKIELKNEFLILSLDRLGGTHEGGQDADVKTSECSWHEAMGSCVYVL
jgi:hypothetical protein